MLDCSVYLVGGGVREDFPYPPNVTREIVEKNTDQMSVTWETREVLYFFLTEIKEKPIDFSLSVKKYNSSFREKNHFHEASIFGLM